MQEIYDPAASADAYYARLDEARERLLMSVSCETCLHFRHAPSEWSSVGFGYCENVGEFVLADDVPGEAGCEDFEE